MEFHLAFPREILPIFNAILMVFIPIFTATHAITSTDCMQQIAQKNNKLTFDWERY